jgi:hypothetical protein
MDQRCHLRHWRSHGSIVCARRRAGDPGRPTPESVPVDGLYHKPDGTIEPSRMGFCWTAGKGKVFYFTPGHETYNDYFRPEVR